MLLLVEKQKKDRFQMAKNVRVLIVEDHDMARMGLSVVLGNNDKIEVVGMSADGQDGVDKALELILFVASIPSIVGKPISIITTSGISSKAGADGYITKGATSEQTVSAVLAVSEGAGWLDPAIAKVVLTNIRRGDSSNENGINQCW